MKDEDCSDPALEEIWEIREKLAAQFDHDPDRLFEYIMEYQKTLGARLVSHRKSEGDEPPAREPAA
ncbi:MAG TPA: hypothetical protein VHG91_03575 [Longimicrobium sp.]|nr:hypothetical protein [Longimicrobium sp.]